MLSLGLGQLVLLLGVISRPVLSQDSSTYVVEPGDTLSQIARDYGVTVAQILAENPSITDPNLIHAGTTLTLPSTPTSTSTPQPTPQPTPVAQATPVTGDAFLCQPLPDLRCPPYPERARATAGGNGIRNRGPVPRRSLSLNPRQWHKPRWDWRGVPQWKRVATTTTDDTDHDGFDTTNNTDHDGYDTTANTDNDGFDTTGNTDRDGFDTTANTDHDGFDTTNNTDNDGFDTTNNTDNDGFDTTNNTDNDGFDTTNNTDNDGFDTTNNTDNDGFDTTNNTDNDGFDTTGAVASDIDSSVASDNFSS